MLHSIFYARFHPLRGPTVIHQYPSNSIHSSTSSSSHFSSSSTSTEHTSRGQKDPILTFSDISSLVIPPYDLCGRAIAIRTRHDGPGGRPCRILGYPVSLEDAKYARNRFTFNVCFVLDESAEELGPQVLAAWESVVKKTARFFRQLEVDDGILLREDGDDNANDKPPQSASHPPLRIIPRLLRTLVQDLATYRETCIRLSSLHVLNLRLYTSPSLGPPPALPQPWQVPLPIRPLADPKDWTWDLVLQRIWPCMDGTLHILRIAEQADVEVQLVQRAVRDLVFHQRVLLLNLFHFRAIYTLTEKFPLFVEDEDLVEECSNYVAVMDPTKSIFYDPSPKSPHADNNLTKTRPSKATLIALYRHLLPGTTLHDFVLAHQAQLQNIDLRRLVTFGVLKGFLRRMHKYLLAVESSTPFAGAGGGGGSGSGGGGSGATTTAAAAAAVAAAAAAGLSSGSGSGSGGAAGSKPRSNEEVAREMDRAWKQAALTSGWETPPSVSMSLSTSMPAEPSLMDGGGGAEGGLGAAGKEREDDDDDEETLRAFLDGAHCMDEICVTLRLTEAEVMEKLAKGSFGEVLVFCK